MKRTYLARKLRSARRNMLIIASRETRRQEYQNSLMKKRKDMSSEELEQVLDVIMELSEPKMEKAAVFWIGKKSLDVFDKNEMDIFDKAYKILERKREAFEKFDSPEDVVESNKKYDNKINYNPDNVKEFTNKERIGRYVIYDVEDSKEGQQAVRDAIDVCFGEIANPWCLAARQYDNLRTAWNYWKKYDAYQKRIAFTSSGKLVAFCANDDNELAWWDRRDARYHGFPEGNVFDERGYVLADDIEGAIKDSNRTDEFFEMYNQASNDKSSSDTLAELATSEKSWVRKTVAMNPNTPSETLDVLSRDKFEVVIEAAQNPNLNIETMKRLISSQNNKIKRAVMQNPAITEDIIEILLDNLDMKSRKKIAKDEETSENILLRLSQDNNKFVRYEVARNENATEEMLITLAQDDNPTISKEAFRNRNLSKEAIIELCTNDKSLLKRFQLCGRYFNRTSL